MILTPKAIEEISKSVKCKTRLALALDRAVDTIHRLLSKNEDNGDLTKVAALEVIEEETGLSQSEILTEEVKA